MSKLARYNQKVFGSTASTNQMGEYGSFAAGTPARYSGATITPDIVQALGNFLTGWYGAVVGLNSPSIEDMNALCYLFAYQLSYLFQAGVPEWNSAAIYYIGSLVNDGSGNLYKSIVDTNVNHALTDPTKWTNTSQYGLTKLAVNNWVLSNSSEANEWYNVIYAGGQFVAIAWNGTHRIMTSPDGKNWTNQTAAEANALYGIAYGNSIYAVVSSAGTHTIQSSPDAVSWTVRTSPSASSWLDVTFGNGKFVAAGIGAALSSAIMTSTDGITWTNRTAVGSRFLSSVAYSDTLNLFVAVSQDGVIITSPDGITWTQRTTPATITVFSKVRWGGGLFVAIAYDGALPTNKIAISIDGITWSLVTLPRSNQFNNLVYGAGTWVMVDVDQTGKVLVSTDGSTWHDAYQCAPGGTQQLPEAIAYGAGVFVNINFSGSNPQVFTTLRLDNLN